MAAKNTPEDLGFASMYLDYMSRRASSPEQRARAQILLGLIRLLDVRYPGWREVFLADLEARSESREIATLFELPPEAEDELFGAFLQSLNLNKKDG